MARGDRGGEADAGRQEIRHHQFDLPFPPSRPGGGGRAARSTCETTTMGRISTDSPRGRGASLVATVAETEAGAVVPSPTVLAKPGLVLVRCDLHPWSRGWIAVFGHPYFTTTDVNGAFTIDSVPPGRYRLVVWHERFGTRSDSVTVVAGGSAAAAMKFGSAERAP